jgi:hypothetical protein
MRINGKGDSGNIDSMARMGGFVKEFLRLMGYAGSMGQYVRQMASCAPGQWAAVGEDGHPQISQTAQIGGTKKTQRRQDFAPLRERRPSPVSP